MILNTYVHNVLYILLSILYMYMFSAYSIYIYTYSYVLPKTVLHHEGGSLPAHNGHNDSQPACCLCSPTDLDMRLELEPYLSERIFHDGIQRFFQYGCLVDGQINVNNTQHLLIRFVHNTKIQLMIADVCIHSRCVLISHYTPFKSVQFQTLVPLGSPYWQLQDPRAGIRSFFRRGVVRSKPNCQPQESRKITRLCCYFTVESMLDF